jgi:predicted nucleotidyltransferase
MTGEQFPDEWRQAVIQWAEQTPLITSVHLFGSRAKGTARDDSDIDLAFECSPGEGGNALSVAIFNRTKWQGQLQAVLPRTVDLQYAEPEEGEIVWPAVMDHGVKLV